MSCLNCSIISLRNILKLAYLCKPNYKRSMGQIVYLLMYVYNNKILFCFLSSCAAYMAQEQMRNEQVATPTVVRTSVVIQRASFAVAADLMRVVFKNLFVIACYFCYVCM